MDRLVFNKPVCLSSHGGEASSRCLCTSSPVVLSLLLVGVFLSLIFSPDQVHALILLIEYFFSRTAPWHFPTAKPVSPLIIQDHTEADFCEPSPYAGHPQWHSCLDFFRSNHGGGPVWVGMLTQVTRKQVMRGQFSGGNECFPQGLVWAEAGLGRDPFAYQKGQCMRPWCGGSVSEEWACGIGSHSGGLEKRGPLR